MNDDETLTALYAKRQEILKQLSEVDSQIRAVELRVQQRNATNVKVEATAIASGNNEVDQVLSKIQSSLDDPSDLRDGLRVIEMFKGEFHGDGDPSEHNRLRSCFVQGCIRHALPLSLTANGSEFIQHLIPVLSSGNSTEVNDSDPSKPYSELLCLIHTLSTDFIRVCASTNGARVAQRIVDSLQTPEEFEALTSIVGKDVVALATDINGNHSLTKIMSCEKMKRQVYNDFYDAHNPAEKKNKIQNNIYAEMTEKCIEICRSRQGCCVIQKSLQWAPEPYHSTILHTVLSNVQKLVVDPFGNYVIQFVLERPQDISTEGNSKSYYVNQIIRHMLHHIAELSCNKFSSNVIEKCLKAAEPDVRQLILDELTEPQAVAKLLTDNFANYVIQTAISTASNEAQFNQLRDAILPHQALLRNSPYGVKIEAKLTKRHRESNGKSFKKRGQPFHYNQNPTFNLPTIQMMTQDGQTVSLANVGNVSADHHQLFQQSSMMNSVPFMINGQQMFSLPESQISQFSVNVMGGDGSN
ncbi:hypothetical protein AGDE_02297 [Angomonas deanei]|nr:hypothetical protein AGDE_07192 [Angomonas deanei]EPY41627.1 hypothetical protein AGDE_02297 [Angomonas deanei]|eukprot:EPY35881.1 hypothetical protein AGDE_07192 [Angomonas deanei]